MTLTIKNLRVLRNPTLPYTLRPATLSDLVEVAESMGGVVLPTNSIEDEEFGELLPVLHVEEHGRYLVIPLEEAVLRALLLGDGQPPLAEESPVTS